MRRPHQLKERGAVAIIFAVCSLLIFSLAALAVDLGNAYARKRDIQTQADLAALAAGALLPDSIANRPAILAEAKTFAEKNLIQGQDALTWDLSDADKSDGWVEFFPDNPNKLRLFAPYARVDFGLAGVMGFSGTDVTAQATVAIHSPVGPAPFYAVSGCDYGQETLSQPPPGPAPSITMQYQTDNNDATLTTLATTPTATTPPTVPLNATGPTAVGLTIDGAGFNGDADSGPVTQVGFFRQVGSLPTDMVTDPIVSVNPAGTQVSVLAIPLAVTVVPDVWYVRVLKKMKPSGPPVLPALWPDKWSAPPGLPFRVGSGTLECGSGPTAGNFGTIVLPRTDGTPTSDWLPLNMATEVTPPLSLAKHPLAPFAAGFGSCNITDALPTIASTGPPVVAKPLTNCVETQPGLAANVATQGFIAGVNAEVGRLDRATSLTPDPDDDPSVGCAPTGSPYSSSSSSEYTTNVRTHPSDPYITINNDLLSCFFTNPSTTVGDIAIPDGAGYNASGNAVNVISEKIFESPRFMFVPIFSPDAASGTGTSWFKIIGFRPAFITDQPDGATYENKWVNSGTTNGLKFSASGSGLETIKVIFFNERALPSTLLGGGRTVDYFGSGPKVLTLIE